jgi:hypothetical protein
MLALLLALCAGMFAGGLLLLGDETAGGASTGYAAVTGEGSVEAVAADGSATSSEANATLTSGFLPRLGPVVEKGCTGCSAPWDNAYDVDSLPAWRWRSIDFDVDTSGGFMGVTGGLKNIPNAIAEMLFAVANWIWSVLLGILKFGFEADEILKLGAGAINAGAAFVGGKLLYVGILFVAILGWRLMKPILTMQVGVILRTSLSFLLAFGALFLVTDRAREAHTNFKGDPGAQMQVVGTLPWMASKVLDTADMVTEPLTGTVLGGIAERTGTDDTADKVISGGDVTAGVASDPTGGGPTTCYAYNEALYRTYTNNPLDTERTMIVLSRMWENTFYDSWRTAAFGPSINYTTVDGNKAFSNIPERIMCHYAESVNEIPASVQHKIAIAAYNSAGQDAFPTPAAGAPTVFGPFDATNNKDQRKAMTAWAACKWDTSSKSWVTQVEWIGSWEDDGGDRLAAPYDDICSSVMQNKESFDDKFYVFAGDVKKATAYPDEPGSEAHREQLKAARTYGISYGGGWGGSRFFYGILSILVAGLFLISFGFIGLGLFASMLMAIACLAFALPVAFALYAIGRTKQAVPLFKVSITSLLSQSFFTIVLSLVVILGGLFQALINGVAELPPVLAALANGLAPVGAFMLIRKLMKSMGMADILTPSGALSFGATAALGAAQGKKSMSGAAAQTKGLLNKTPWLGKKMEKLDRYAPTKGNWSLDGRLARKEASIADKAEREQRLREKMEKRNALYGENSRRAQALNRLSARGLPDGTTNRLRGISAGGAMAILTGVLAGPVGVAALGGAALWNKYKKTKRNVGADTIEGAESIGETYTSGETFRGKDAAARRTETVSDTKDYVERIAADVHQSMLIDVPGSSYAERVEAGYDEAFTKLAGAFALATTGSEHIRTDLEVDSLRIAAAEHLGYTPAGIAASSLGVAVPVPYSVERMKAELSDEQLQHFTHWLPATDREVQQVREIAPDGTAYMRSENMEEYANRLIAMGVARGVVHPDGSSVDVLSLKGLDIRDSAVQARVEAWRGGAADDLLDNLQIGAVDEMLERRLVLASRRAAARDLTPTYAPAASSAAGGGGASAPVDISTIRDAATALTASARSMTDTTAQLVLAVSASRKLLDAARSGGDTVAIEAAAQKMIASMERLESQQEALLDGLGNIMVENLEKQLAVSAIREENFTKRFEDIFGSGVDEISDQIGAVAEVLESFKAGTAEMTDVLASLEGTLGAVSDASSTTTERLAELLAQQDRNPSRGTGVRSKGAYIAPSSKDIVGQSNPIPGDSV